MVVPRFTTRVKGCVVSNHLNHLNKAYDCTEHTFILWNAAWYGVTINSHRIKLPLNPQSNFYVRKGVWSHQSSAVVCYIHVCIVCAQYEYSDETDLQLEYEWKPYICPIRWIKYHNVNNYLTLHLLSKDSL